MNRICGEKRSLQIAENKVLPILERPVVHVCGGWRPQLDARPCKNGTSKTAVFFQIRWLKISENKGRTIRDNNKNKQ